MKFKLFIGAIMLLAFATMALAQGALEWDKNGNAPVPLIAPKSITNYTHTKAAITIPIATNVSQYCIRSTADGTIQINGAGGTKRITAATDYCRGVGKGVTSIVFTGASSAAKTIDVEKQY